MTKRRTNSVAVVPDIFPPPRLSPRLEFSDVAMQVCERFGLKRDHHDLSFTVGTPEELQAKRREMEAVADIFEGVRARLMNASHSIQMSIDRRKRGHG